MRIVIALHVQFAPTSDIAFQIPALHDEMESLPQVSKELTLLCPCCPDGIISSLTTSAMIFCIPAMVINIEKRATLINGNCLIFHRQLLV